MAFSLRPYQQEAVDAVMDHIPYSFATPLIILPTGAGKSLVVAELARLIHQASRKPVLCLAPTSELVIQNKQKYEAYGFSASIYSSSAGGKSLRHPVVFGSPKTVANDLRKFGDFAAIIIDEAHGLTPTLIMIIEAMRQRNPNIRIIGMTATPYRMLTGYIFKYHYQRGPTDDSNAVNPFFDTVVYELTAQQLIAWGFLTPPLIGETAEGYDTSGLVMDKMGRFDPATVAKAFEGWGRKTSSIVADVVRRSEPYRSVLMFAATRKHAEEVTASLPSGTFESVFANTPKKLRGEMLEAFKNNEFKYMVNQRILTTGFDSPITDVIAILTATESAALYQQIVGRGTRLCDVPYPSGRKKEHFLLLDYAGNLDRHFENTGDVFTPEITARKPASGEPMAVTCPACQFENSFTARANPEKLKVSPEGYFVDGRGRPILQEVLKAHRDEDGVFTGDFVYKDIPVPAHFGRRCTNQRPIGPRKEMLRCPHMFESKDCPKCAEPNDIAARFCSACKSELVNPNEKLQLEAARLEKDPHARKQSKVQKIYLQRHWSQAGDQALKVIFETDHKLKKFQSIEKLFIPDHDKLAVKMIWRDFSRGAFGEVLSIDEAIARRASITLPDSIIFQRKKGDRFVEIKNIIWGKKNG